MDVDRARALPAVELATGMDEGGSCNVSFTIAKVGERCYIGRMKIWSF